MASLLLCTTLATKSQAPDHWSSVECGGLPPLYAVPACRDVLQDRAIRGARGLLGGGCSDVGQPRIGRSKLRPKTAAASRRTPHKRIRRTAFLRRGTACCARQTNLRKSSLQAK